eukprot:753664-Hanusia_phi.AAC.2
MEETSRPVPGAQTLAGERHLHSLLSAAAQNGRIVSLLCFHSSTCRRLTRMKSLQSRLRGMSYKGRSGRRTFVIYRRHPQTAQRCDCKLVV